MAFEEPNRGMLFDAVAGHYDRVRPGYPAALFDDLVDIAGATAEAHVLEVGCGTGQATRDLLARGWTVTAVEPGAAMVALAQQQLPADRFKVEQATFEEWDPSGRTFDLVFSATAFHWVEPGVRWSKAASILKEGGHLALATNNTVFGGSFSELYAASSELHETYGWAGDDPPAPTLEEAIVGLESATADIGALWGMAAELKARVVPANDVFEAPVVRWHPWEERYTGEEAALLLGTYSPYLALPERPRVRLLAGIRALIDDRFGGEVTRKYLSVLAVARRR